MIKFLIYFSISFFILAIPVKKRSLFYHLDQRTNSYTDTAYEKINAFIDEKIGSKKLFGMRIFDVVKEKPAVAESKSVSKNKNDVSKIAGGKSSKSNTSVGGKRGARAHSTLDLNKKSEVLGDEYYSEKELYQLKMMLKNSDI